MSTVEELETGEKSAVESALAQKKGEILERMSSKEIDEIDRLKLASQALALFPEEAEGIRANFPFDKTLEAIGNNITSASLKGEERFGDYITALSYFARLYPEKTADMPKRDEAGEAVERDLDISLTDDKPILFLQQARLYEDLFYDEVHSSKNHEDFDAVISTRIGQIVEQRAQKKDWRSLCGIMASVKKVFPENYNFEELEDKKDRILKALRQSIDSSKPEYYAAFAADAKELGLID